MHKHTGTHLPRKDASEQVRKTYKKRLSFPFRQTETKLSRKEKPEPDEAPTGADLPFKRNRSYPPSSLTPTSTRLTRQSFRAERVFPAYLSLSLFVSVWWRRCKSLPGRFPFPPLPSVLQSESMLRILLKNHLCLLARLRCRSSSFESYRRWKGAVIFVLWAVHQRNWQMWVF